MADLDRINAHLDRLAARQTQLQLRLCDLEAEASPAPRPAANTPPSRGEPTEPVTPTREPERTTASSASADPTPHKAEPASEPLRLTTLESLLAARQRQQSGPAEHAAGRDEPVGQVEPTARDTAAPAPVSHAEHEPSSGSADDQPIDFADASPARRLSLEEMLAGKVFVWIGAIALVLTAAFLLKLGFDSGIITEPVRVVGAAVFGLILWGVGEWARGRASLVTQALCGAAVAVLYASVLAGHNLYHLFGSPWAFGLMAAITAAAVLLSLRHGRTVALLGMVGGFMLPPMLGESFGQPTSGMVLYLLALEIGVLTVTGRRGWFGLSTLTLAFTVVWSLGYVLIGDSAGERTLTAMLIVGTASAYLVQTARIHRDPQADPRSRRWAVGLSIAAACSAAAVVALLVPRGGFATRELWMLGLVAAGTIVLARLDRRYLAIPFATMGLSLLVLLAAALTLRMGGAIASAGPDLGTLITTTIAYGCLYLLGGYACLWGASHKRSFALMSVIAGPAYYAVILLAGQPTLGDRAYWWPYTLMLAGVYAVALVPLLRRRTTEHDHPTAMLSVTCFGLVCVAIVQGLDHPAIAVCLALVSAGAALIDRRLFIRPLLVASRLVASLTAVLLVVPGPFTVDIHGVIVFNTLLPMYLLPAIGFGVIAWCARQSGEHRTADAMARLTVATLTAMLAVLTRQAFHPGGFLAESTHLYEWAAYACVLMLGALVGLFATTRLRLDTARRAWVCVAAIGAVVGFIGALAPGNPLLQAEPKSGWPMVLDLVGLYILPAVLMGIWSRRRSVSALPPLRDTLQGMAITLVALWAGVKY